ncbi:unnamed protein product [Ectocarpus sp. 12 AP-2014]
MVHTSGRTRNRILVCTFCQSQSGHITESVALVHRVPHTRRASFLHPIYSGCQSTRFGKRLTHHPGSRTRKVNRHAFIPPPSIRHSRPCAVHTTPHFATPGTAERIDRTTSRVITVTRNHLNHRGDRRVVLETISENLEANMPAAFLASVGRRASQYDRNT